MPNGGSDHCGNCRHNRINIGRTPALEQRLGPSSCTVTACVLCGARHYVRWWKQAHPGVALKWDYEKESPDP